MHCLSLVALLATCGVHAERLASCRLGGSGAPHPRLCGGMVQLHAATCAQLSNASFVRQIVETVGLVPDLRARKLYGRAERFTVGKALNVTGRRFVSGVGMWQNPLQLAQALLHIGATQRVRAYLEVGVFSAWTCVLMSAYLDRVNRCSGGAGTTAEAAFRGYAVDTVPRFIKPGTRALLTELHVDFVRRRDMAREVLPKRPHRTFDLCFIDAGHSYAEVRADYEQLAPFCGACMFHDIVDISTVRQGNWTGGTVLFWRHLAQSVRPERLRTFTSQLTKQGPFFGIGVLAPSSGSGTAEPDTPFAQWPQPSPAGDKAALFEALCSGGRGAATQARVQQQLCGRLMGPDALGEVVEEAIQV